MTIHRRTDRKKRPLHLILKHKWFDLIEAGEKTVKCRDNTPYWRKRIFQALPETVEFHRGKTHINMQFKITFIAENSQIEIHLGDRIK